ncbi:MAG TPA: EndoU domain-containing protein [Pseudogracilibacillus sp.]|nr:EndoU domain-containing protein [Pseudogracilibacillus sp.]
MKRINIMVFIFLFAFTLVGCGLNDIYLGEEDSKITAVTPITELTYTEHFRQNALEHILEGELNKQGEAVGFHYAQLPTRNGEVIEETETEEDDHGIYEAKVIVSEIEKTSNGGKSTFFPDHWDSQDVVDAINEAYDNRTFISGNTYEGLTEEGIIIRMYLDTSEKIISAFPIYEGV